MDEFKDLEDKLQAAEKERVPKRNRIQKTLSKGGENDKNGAQAGLELVGAIVVSTGIGIGLDRWLGTSPWMLLMFFFLGLFTGFYNVYRITQGIGTSVGLSVSDKKLDD